MKAMVLTFWCVLALAACHDNPDTGFEGEAGSQPRLVTLLSKTTIAAGEWTTVECAVVDDLGSPLEVEGLTTTFEVSAGATADLEQSRAGSEVVGSYEVTCRAEGMTLETSPKTFEVEPADPVAVALAVDPDKTVYKVGDDVAFTWLATDAFGNEVPDLAGTLTGDEQIGVEREGDAAFSFSDEGVYTFALTLAKPWDSLGDSLTLTCDGTGPEIVIKKPLRGQTLVGTGEAAIEVVGTVSDTVSEVTSLTIAGLEVPVDADGSFTFAYDPMWGLNVIDAEAFDAFGNRTLVSPTFQYSSEYVPFVDADAEGVKASDGAKVLLGQSFLDDGDHDPSHVDDMATLVELLVNNLDVSAFVDTSEEPLHFEFPVLDEQIAIDAVEGGLNLQGTLQVDVTIVESTSVGTAKVALDAREEGIDVDIDLGDDQSPALNVELNIDVTLPLDVTFVVYDQPIETTVTGEASFTTQVEIDKLGVVTSIHIDMPEGGELQVVTEDIDVDLQGLRIDPFEDLGFTFSIEVPGSGAQSFDFQLSDYFDLTQITDFILDPITENIVPAVVDGIEPAVEGFAGDILKDLILAFELELPIELPELLEFQPKALDVYTNLTSVKFTEKGGEIGLSLGVWAEQGVDREIEGAIRRDGCLNGLNAQLLYDWKRELGAGLKVDAVNAALFSVWWSGYLTGPQDLTEMLSGVELPIPIDGLVADFDFMLPPVLNDCQPGDTVEVEIGDLSLGIVMQAFNREITAQLFVDAIIGLAFESTPEGLKIKVAEIRFFDVEVSQLSDPFIGALNLGALLEDGLGELALGKLAGLELGPIELPEVELSELTEMVPPGVSLNLGGLSVNKQQGFLVVGLDVE